MKTGSFSLSQQENHTWVPIKISDYKIQSRFLWSKEEKKMALQTWSSIVTLTADIAWFAGKNH